MKAVIRCSHKARVPATAKQVQYWGVAVLITATSASFTLTALLAACLLIPPKGGSQ